MKTGKIESVTGDLSGLDPLHRTGTAFRGTQIKVLLFLWMLTASGVAQSVSNDDRKLRGLSVAGMNDMGKIKLLAERGNFNAQLKLAGACMGSHLFADALHWYSAAADQGG